MHGVYLFVAHLSTSDFVQAELVLGADRVRVGIVAEVLSSGGQVVGSAFLISRCEVGEEIRVRITSENSRVRYDRTTLSGQVLYVF